MIAALCSGEMGFSGFIKRIFFFFLLKHDTLFPVNLLGPLDQEPFSLNLKFHFGSSTHGFEY